MNITRDKKHEISFKATNGNNNENEKNKKIASWYINLIVGFMDIIINDDDDDNNNIVRIQCRLMVNKENDDERTSDTRIIYERKKS